jgi:hypothetical protein
MTDLTRRAVLRTPALLAASSSAGLLLFPTASHAQIASMSDAIEKAETLFMLSQRAAKAYFAIGLGVRVPEAKKVLESSVQRFDRLLIELKAYSTVPAMKKTFTDMGTAWEELKIELIGKVPSQSSGPQIVALNGKVYELANSGSSQLQIAAKTPVSKLQDVAGNVRMLSQRLTKNYFRKNWGVLADAAALEIETTAKAYLEGKAFLLAAPQTTAAVKSQITLANNQWSFIDSAINSKKAATPANYSDVWGASENVLSVMDSVCTAYGKLA